MPSFKNSKLLTRGKLITKPAYQTVMKEITRALVSGLRSFILTGDAGILMGLPARYLIVSCERLQNFDDNRFWIEHITVEALEVPNGEEGFDLTLILQ